MLKDTQTRMPAMLMAAALCVAGVSLRVIAVPAGVGDVDSVNHAHALRQFDPFAQAPHFPGYPVYTALTQWTAALGFEEVWALALPGIALFAFAAPLLTWSLWSAFGATAALGTLTFAALAPGAVVASAWPSSDGMGFSLLLLAAGLALRPGALSRLAAGLCLGLLLGVRLSYAPLVVSLLMLCLVFATGTPARLRLLSATAVGVACWAVPMLVLLEPARLWALATGFVVGHFQEFGGAASTVDSAPLAARLARYAWSLWDAGLGAAYPLAVPGLPFQGEHGQVGMLLAVVLGLLVALFLGTLPGLRGRRLAQGAVLLAPYALWLLLAQNPDKPRHLIPLLPMIGLALSLAAGLRGRAGQTVLAAVAALLLLSSASRAPQQGQVPVPARALSASLGAPGQASRLVLAGPDSRLLLHAQPALRVLRPLDYATAEREARRAASLGVHVFMTSSVPGLHPNANLHEVQRFRFPVSVRPQDAQLTLYRYQPSATEASQRAALSLVQRSDLR